MYPSAAVTQNNATANNDMPEFCAALLIVTKQLDEYQLWQSRYLLDDGTVSFWRELLDLRIDQGRTDPTELWLAAAQCITAREEAERGNE
jgi:hypothetical protein